MARKELILRGCRFADIWLGQLRMLRDIWTGAYPSPDSPQPRPLLVERLVMTVLVALRLLSISRFMHLPHSNKTKSLLAEVYVLAWLSLLLVLLFEYSSIGRPATVVIVSYRLVDALAYRLCILFVDRYRPRWGLHSLNRTLLLLLLNYFELAIGFAVLYLAMGAITLDGQAVPITEPGRALYFSIITLSTLGFGDIVPLASPGMLLSALEVLAGFILVVLVIGAFLTGLRDIRSLKVLGSESGEKAEGPPGKVEEETERLTQR